MFLTPTEIQIKSILERSGLKVLKGSFPDFIVWKEPEKKFCLLEVKKAKQYANHHYLHGIPNRQSLTIHILKNLGIPVLVCIAEDEEKKIVSEVQDSLSKNNTSDNICQMRGRGHKKIEQDGVVKKISEDHGLPVVRLPKAVLKLGVKLNQQVIITYENENPLSWEIRIKPVAKEAEVA